MEYHVHHIIPKHSGGSDDPNNLVKLTIEEHANAHKLLWENAGNKLDYIAWQALSGQINSNEARIKALKYVCSTEEHRKKLRKPKLNTHNMMENTNGFKPGYIPHNKGKSVTEYVSEESMASWSKKMQGNKNAAGPRSEETKKRMRGPRSPLTAERKKQISEQMKKIWKERKNETIY